jgi:hypothetical protein
VGVICATGCCAASCGGGCEVGCRVGCAVGLASEDGEDENQPIVVVLWNVLGVKRSRCSIASQCREAGGYGGRGSFHRRDAIEFQLLDLGGLVGRNVGLGGQLKRAARFAQVVCSSSRCQKRWCCRTQTWTNQSSRQPLIPRDAAHQLSTRRHAWTCSICLATILFIAPSRRVFCANSFLLRSQTCCSLWALCSSSSDRGSFLSHSYLLYPILSVLRLDPASCLHVTLTLPTPKLLTHSSPP